MAPLLLAACGPRWIYPNLDWMVPWTVADYVSLDRRQQSQLAYRLSRQLEWHCRTQLHRYADVLRDVGQNLQSPGRPLSITQLNRYQVILEGLWRDLVRRLGPEIGDILATATDRQIEELFDNLEKENKRFEDRYVHRSEEEIVSLRYQRMEKGVSYWIGKLSDTQKEAVADWSRQSASAGALRISNRRRVQATFRSLLSRRQEVEDFSKAFTDLLLGLKAIETADYGKQRAERRRLVLRLLVRLENGLSATQRSTLIERIGNLSGDFDRLSCRIEDIGDPGP
jgi:hypothetical protein